MPDGQHGPGEADFDFIVGTTADQRVLIDFRGMKIDHMKMTDMQALFLAETLVEAAKQVKQGIVTHVQNVDPLGDAMGRIIRKPR